jgi:hypothetical protein
VALPAGAPARAPGLPASPPVAARGEAGLPPMSAGAAASPRRPTPGDSTPRAADGISYIHTLQEQGYLDDRR